MHIPRIIKLYFNRFQVLGSLLALTLGSIYFFITFNNDLKKIDQLTVIFPESPDMDLTWTKQFLTLDFRSFPFKSPQKGIDGRIPFNKGFEAMTYLSFIIQNYEKLPEKMAFIHGHHSSWHQPEKI